MLYGFDEVFTAPVSVILAWVKMFERANPFDRIAEEGQGMGRVIKALVLLVMLGFIGLAGYAYLGDIDPVRSEVKKDVVLNAD